MWTNIRTTSLALSSSSPTQPLSPISNYQKWDELAEAERELCDQLSAIESTPVYRQTDNRHTRQRSATTGGRKVCLSTHQHAASIHFVAAFIM